MKDKVLFNDPNLSILEAEGWYRYAHMSRTEKGQLVAVLVYKKDGDKVTEFLGRYENCPAHHDGLQLTSITGGVDHGSWHLPAVLQELEEEAGVPVEYCYGDVQKALSNDNHMERLEYVGDCRISKQEDTLCHLYTFNATGIVLNASTGDGTQGEETAYCGWVQPYQLLNCKCPLPTLIAVRSGLIWKV